MSVPPIPPRTLAAVMRDGRAAGPQLHQVERSALGGALGFAVMALVAVLIGFMIATGGTL